MCQLFAMLTAQQMVASLGKDMHTMVEVKPSLFCIHTDKVDTILNQLHEKDLKTPELGLRAFSWNVEKMI